MVIQTAPLPPVAAMTVALSPIPVAAPPMTNEVPQTVFPNITVSPALAANVMFCAAVAVTVTVTPIVGSFGSVTVLPSASPVFVYAMPESMTAGVAAPVLAVIGIPYFI
jgi:hypothetical protein